MHIYCMNVCLKHVDGASCKTTLYFKSEPKEVQAKYNKVVNTLQSAVFFLDDFGNGVRSEDIAWFTTFFEVDNESEKVKE